MHPASYAEWITLIERYRRAVKAYSEAVRVLASIRDSSIDAPEYQLACKRVEQEHLICEQLRGELRVYEQLTF